MNQKERDDAVEDLAMKMVDLFSWVQETDTLPDKVAHLGHIIGLMVQQVKECALFIMDYAKQGFLSMSTCLYPNIWF